MLELANPTVVSIQAIDSRSDFEAVTSDAIDHTLSAFGETVKNAIYKAIEAKSGVKKHQIPYKIEAFSHSIEFLFGQAAVLIEIRIIQTLSQKVRDFRYRPKTGEIAFVEYMTALQKHLNR